MRKKCLIGQTFDCLTGIGESEIKGFYKFKCKCGNIVDKRKYDVVSGKTKSCGCIKSERIKKSKTKHGLSGSNIYMIWSSIKARCFNRNNSHYNNYGGRGITICNEWKNDFLSFYNWAMKNGYKKKLSIERIDVNKNYCPENCTWIPIREQSLNRTTTVKVLYNGKLCNLFDLCKELNIPYKRAIDRYKKGFIVSRILSKHKLNNDYENLKLFTLNGETKNLSEWCRIYNKKYCTIWSRIFRHNKTFEEALDI